MTVSCNSWVVVSKATGEAVLETFSRKVADRVDRGRYDVLTAYDYLVRLNATVRPS